LRRFASLFLRLSAIGIGLLSLSGCFHLPTFTPTPTITAVVPTATKAVTPMLPTITPSATPLPAPSGEPKTVELGKPFWIGRGQMVDAVFLPGAKQVAIAWGSGVSVNDVASGQELWFQPTPTNVLAFDAQPQGKQLATALADGSVMLFDASSGESLPFQGAAPDAEAGDIAWSPDGKTVAFQFIGPARGDPIYLLDVASGQVSQAPDTKIDPAVVPALAWSPDGSALTLATLGSTCPPVVDAHSGQQLMQPAASGPLYSSFPLAWMPDGKLLAVGAQNGGVALLRFPECNQARYLWSSTRIDVTPGVKRSLFIDPAGKWMAFRGGVLPLGYDYGQPFTVWNLASDSVQAEMTKPLQSLAQRRRMAAVFNGDSILILYESGEITRWNFTDPSAAEQIVSQVHAMPISPSALVWSADGSRLAFSGRYGGVEVWDAATGQLVGKFDPPLDTPAISADGRKLALFDPVKKVETIYDVASGGALRSLDASLVLLGPAFSPDGHSLAYSAGGQAQIADLDSTQVAALEPAPADGLIAKMVVTRLIWSPDSQALVTAFAIPGSEEVGSGLVILWKRDAGGIFKEVAHVPEVQAGYQQLSLTLAIFNPSGSRVALQSFTELGTNQLKLIVYDLAAGKAILTLDRYLPGAWVNDAEILVSNPSYGLERINVVTGDRKSEFGNNQVNAYAPGGIFTMRQATTGGRGILISYWQEIENTQITARGTFEPPVLSDFGWSPDGRWAWAVGSDGTARLWPVTTH
jgi:WD40 repeat protein